MEKLEIETGNLAGQRRQAMRLSLLVGILMLIGKGSAYLLTGSAAILSDAAESVVHVIAVAFAAFSLWLSAQPPSRRYTYGFERISFFSAGFEGALIILAAATIVVTAVEKWIEGSGISHLGKGTVLIACAGALNAALGWYLVRQGRKTNSLILEANGKHVLTDSWTSLGVVGGLLLVMLSGWQPLDSIFAIGVAVNIIWSGGKLIFRSVEGLMDYSDPDVAGQIRRRLDQSCQELEIEYHGIRFRDTGVRLKIEFHLLFPFDMPLGKAHQLATSIEERIKQDLNRPADIVSHLEALEDHSQIHQRH